MSDPVVRVHGLRVPRLPAVARDDSRFCGAFVARDDSRGWYASRDCGDLPGIRL